jgi:hypothetical protein
VASGWDHALVPRNTADASGSYAPAPTSILSQSCYWNLGLQNHGGGATTMSSTTTLDVDGDLLMLFSQEILAAGEIDQYWNQGTINVPGGRHCFTAALDRLGSLPEPDEEDNRFGNQWVWNPTVFFTGNELTRSAPPFRTGGWEYTGAVWYNCDGLRFLSDPPDDLVAAVYIVADDYRDDFDIRLHDYATSATSGFASNLGYSGRPAGSLDAVLVNVANRPRVVYDVGVLTNQETRYDGYRAKVRYDVELPLGTVHSLSFPTDEAMMLYTFEITAADQGPKTVELLSDPGWQHTDIFMAWYDETFTTGTLLSYDSVAQEDSDGDILMHIDVTTGLHTLVLWREPDIGYFSRPFTLQIRDRRPDMATYTPEGWDAPLVPRPTPDAVFNWAPLPASLAGDGDTYLNFSFVNESPGEGGGFWVGVFHDGELSGVAHRTDTGGGIPALYGNTGPWIYPGGRHTMALVIDYLGELEEDDLSNNVYGIQHVWQPALLTLGVAVTRSEPAAPTAGWADVTVDDVLWPNADGMRTPWFQPSGDDMYWGAVAVMPADTSDLDLHLHPLSSGIADGFAEPLCDSTWPPGESDYVLANFNATTDRQFDAGVINGPNPAPDNYSVVATASQFLSQFPDGTFGPYQLDAGDIIGLHEFYADVGDRFIVELDPQTGICDLGLSLHGPGIAYLGKSEVYEDATNGPAMAFIAAPGEVESLDFTIQTLGYHCLVVWKRGTADLALAEEYIMHIHKVSATGVGEDGGLPQITRLVGAYPNPFNPQTTIVFELADPEPVRLQVFDLRGQLVRTLVDQVLTNGCHEVPWLGRDDTGQRVASGNYLLRMQTGRHQAMSRVSLLK